MFTKTMIALSAALVFGTATAAAAKIKGKANNPRAAFALQSAPAAVYAPNWVAGNAAPKAARSARSQAGTYNGYPLSYWYRADSW